MEVPPGHRPPLDGTVRIEAASQETHETLMPTLADLKPDSRNARRHNPRNVGMIESSIQRDGFGRSILLANDGTIIAGNATIDAAASAGIEDVLIVETDGTKVVAVKRTDIAPDSPEFHNLAIADNRTAELADWDADVLAGLQDDIDLDAFFREDEFARLMGDMPDFDPMAEWQGMPEFQQDDQMPVKRLIVNFESEVDVRDFAERIGQPVSMTTKWIWHPAQERQDRKSKAFVSES